MPGLTKVIKLSKQVVLKRIVIPKRHIQTLIFPQKCFDHDELKFNMIKLNLYGSLDIFKLLLELNVIIKMTSTSASNGTT